MSSALPGFVIVCGPMIVGLPLQLGIETMDVWPLIWPRQASSVQAKRYVLLSRMSAGISPT
jgi:hypothetical protein